MHDKPDAAPVTVSAATVRLAKDHFALISALVIVASVLLATVFLFGYLNVFAGGYFGLCNIRTF
jgi:hypothetical protein